jgi:hypothetical protein
VRARQVHDARGQLSETVGLGGYAFGEVPHLVGIVGRHDEGLREEADGADGGLQLVARVLDEILAHLLNALLLGDVAYEDRDELVRDGRGATDDESGVVRDAAHPDPHRLRGGTAVLPGLLHEPAQLLLGESPSGDDAEPARRGRGRQDDARGVGDDGGVLEHIEHRGHGGGNLRIRGSGRPVAEPEGTDDHESDECADGDPDEYCEQGSGHNSRVRGRELTRG